MKFSDIFIFKSQFLALAVSWNGGFLSIFGLDIKLGLLDKVSVNPHLIFFNFFVSWLQLVARTVQRWVWPFLCWFGDKFLWPYLDHGGVCPGFAKSIEWAPVVDPVALYSLTICRRFKFWYQRNSDHQKVRFSSRLEPSLCTFSQG